MLVTFCGHRHIYHEKEIQNKLFVYVEELIKRGATDFMLGGYGEFDFLAASVVKELSGKYSYIKSILVIPYLNREYNMDLYNYSIYPPIESVPLKFAITKRNQWMVDKSDVVVSYVINSQGGSYKTLEYAIKKEKQIIEITL